MTNPWEERIKPSSSRDRDNYSRDRARIIHSAAFRRLQGKTQVLGVGESDFYRTRLTHSIEVAQIAAGITGSLREKYPNYKDILPSDHLIESIALAHDIGHPPFGHGGEIALNYCMHKHGGFEGNAHTLRICSKLGEFSEDAGLNLTRRCLLGLIKYPSTYSKVVNEKAYNNTHAPIKISSFKPPKCIFDCDNTTLSFILAPTSQDDKTHFIEVKSRDDDAENKKHLVTTKKGLDTSILELADDISYGIHDLEDAIALKLVEEKTWDRNVVDKLNGSSSIKNIEEISCRLFSGDGRKRKWAISELVHHFIKSIEMVRDEKISDSLLSLNAKMPSAIKSDLETIKDFVIQFVVKTPEVQTLEYKGQQMIVKIFDAISNNPDRLLPVKYYHEYTQGNQSLRVICDYIAGTTDDYATKLYHKIFTPSTGSIFDRL